MFRVLTGMLKVRYIFLGSAIGGSYSLNKKYEDFKASLPQLPEAPNMNKFIDYGKELLEMFKLPDEWIEEATESVEMSRKQQNNANKDRNHFERATSINEPVFGFQDSSHVSAAKNTKPTLKAKIAQFVQATNNASTSQIDYQELTNIRKELERLKKENRELRTFVKGGGSDRDDRESNKLRRKLKKSLIEIYSEVLDELSCYDSEYKIQDHLPKVVVVGDQSSGKTSVLEMIAGARIFPRGSGEMMTRAPVQVTLSEGMNHIARFNDSSRVYDLSQDSELADLRQEIENRMKKSVEGGKTVSNQVISLTIQGPGIQRMVLVDLPGIIGTVTSELAPDTKECIRDMAAKYMNNPNAIILCIQDGSLDAERSIFTDLVREVDKKGKRTILVMTKVDIAEKIHAKPDKIKKILDGELFPIKALGYFAVIAGKGNQYEEIEEIKDYEDQFFMTSSLCEKGILNPDQCGTRKLSAKVSECFWRMVKTSVEQQVDAYKATYMNLEAEWNHHFPHSRQLGRDELFFNARNEVYNELEKLNRLPTKLWDQFISSKLWERVSNHVFQKIYFPASTDPLHFDAKVDIGLQRWVESMDLPRLAVEVAQDSVMYQFETLLNQASNSKNSSDPVKEESEVYRDLKHAIIHEALERHQWRPKALDTLKVVQLEALSKQFLYTKENWNKAIKFLQENLKVMIEKSKEELINQTGAGVIQRWTEWQSISPNQQKNQAISCELKKLLQSQDISDSQMFRYKLSTSDIIVVRKNLEAQGVNVDDDAIKKVWEPLYKHTFLTKELSRSKECSKMFYFYENDLDSGTNCGHVLFFWRVMRMLEFTANCLRGQILEEECRRIEKQIGHVLDEYQENTEKKTKYLSGKRVELAEELRRVRQIREKLDEFMTALNSDNSY